MSLETICSLLDGKDRTAVAKCAMGYFDGTTLKIFEKESKGKIAEKPAGKNGWDWDKIFVHDGHGVTRASFDDVGYQKAYLMIKPLAKLKKFFKENNL
jgi:inosine/xanthosine triphosphate pyrophosphatase family protein